MRLLSDWVAWARDYWWLQFTPRQASDRWATKVVERSLFRATGGVIAAGPFAGLRITDVSVGSLLGPKLAGCYERELHPTIEDAITEGYDCIFDVGCAEGYYAAGFAWRSRNTRVLAFDLDPEALEITRKVAALNGVAGRVECHGLCDHATFRMAEGKRALVFCDIEGGEHGLLDPLRAPVLLSYDLLVEVHDGPASSRIRDALVGRFGATHHVRAVRSGPREARDLGRAGAAVPARWRMAAAAEGRILGLEWLSFKRKGSRCGE